MPEGDTIFRTAASMRKWILGQAVTDAKTKRPEVQIAKTIGSTIEEIEPKAKHLLIRFSNNLTLHTHMRMTGSWHLYGKDDAWQKPSWQAVVVLECGNRLAVCFNAPVVELYSSAEEATHVALSGLGPDVLNSDPFDWAELHARAELKRELTIGELLLDQRTVSGIGNIYRCESLFLEKLHPTALVKDLPSEQLEKVVKVAMRLMGQSVEGNRHQTWVYKRNGRPCRICGTPIKRADLGERPRTVYWCPRCQQKFV